jgi:hypothetical protein
MKSELVRGSTRIGALFAVAAACGGIAEAPAPPTSATGAQTNEEAITTIAEARCAREEACNNIGRGKSYQSKDACKREASHDARADLRSENCGTIDTNKLDKCVSTINDERCGNPFDAIGRVVACQQKEICLEK